MTTTPATPPPEGERLHKAVQAALAVLIQHSTYSNRAAEAHDELREAAAGYVRPAPPQDAGDIMTSDGPRAAPVASPAPMQAHDPLTCPCCDAAAAQRATLEARVADARQDQSIANSLAKREMERADAAEAALATAREALGNCLRVAERKRENFPLPLSAMNETEEAIASIACKMAGDLISIADWARAAIAAERGGKG